MCDHIEIIKAINARNDELNRRLSRIEEELADARRNRNNMYTQVLREFLALSRLIGGLRR